jgi:hypothetical protein
MHLAPCLFFSRSETIVRMSIHQRHNPLKQSIGGLPILGILHDVSSTHETEDVRGILCKYIIKNTQRASMMFRWVEMYESRGQRDMESLSDSMLLSAQQQLGHKGTPTARTFYRSVVSTFG